MDAKTTVSVPTKQGRRMCATLRLRARLTAALLGSTMLTVLGSAAALADVETGNNTFPGEAASTATLLFGNVGGSDPIDFFDFAGLTPGDAFDFTLGADGINDVDVEFALYTDQTTFSNATALPPNGSGHITGTVPIAGALVLGVTSPDSQAGFETYRLRLDITPQSTVPEPASAALLAAGLGTLAVVRRRRRC